MFNTYHIRSDDQSVELRRCFEQDLACNNKEREKINEQQKIIQESRRQYWSKTLIQILVLLNVAIGLTIIVSSILFISLFRNTVPIISGY